MCGIAGIVAGPSGRPIEAVALDRMARALAHRGPDDQGVYLNDSASAGLAHRRLAVIDVADGHQPLSSEDGKVWVVFNGEIYNFRQLQQRLIGLGHRFATRCDTEVIVHAYEQFGPACVEQFRGMFGLAIWDERRRTLLLARDRLGKKPVFYSLSGGAMVFASEAKGILASGYIDARLDQRSLDAYLRYGYAPAPWAMLADVKKIEPAHYMVFDQSTGCVCSYVRYWSPPDRADPAMGTPAGQRLLAETIAEAVELRTVSDVPLGAFLSGGLDSSLIVALLSRVLRDPVRTFSIGFEEEEFNELPYARLVAEHFGTEHREHVLAPATAAMLERLVWHYDDPLADSSSLPTMRVSEMARRDVTVVLSGDGGDEIFAGYERYRRMRHAELIERWPAPAKWLVREVVGRMAPTVEPGGSLWRHYASRLMHATRRPDLLWSLIACYLHRGELSRLYRPEWLERAVADEVDDWLPSWYRRGRRLGPTGAAMYADLHGLLSEDVNVKVDIASMAVGLETRCPLLDHKVVELAMRMPMECKLTAGESKVVLRRAFGELLPKAIWQRPKAGFSVPVHEWLRGPMRELAGDVLLGATTKQRGIFEARVLEQLWREHQSGLNRARQLWPVLIFELWARRFLDRRFELPTVGTAVLNQTSRRREPVLDA